MKSFFPRWAVVGVLVAAGVWGWASAQAPVPSPTKNEPLRTAGDRPVDVREIALDLKVDLPAKTIEGEARLKYRPLRPLVGFSLDAVEFEVQKVRVQTIGDAGPDSDVPFDHDGKRLHFELPEKARDETKDHWLTVTYRVRQPRSGLHFFGPTDAEPDTPLTVWSQGEATTNRYWFPCLDQPNQRQKTSLKATVAEGFEVLSNGKLVSRKENADKTVTFHWEQEKPHVAYLVSLVVGKFDVVREEHNGVPLAYYVPKGKKDDVSRTFGRTRAMLDFFVRRFGIDYPWEKYAQVVVEQFTSGGMENTSATTLNERAIHDARAILDNSPDGLIAHELAHQWWGDLVTCRDWAHLWLNEGFATYSEAVWCEKDKGADEFAYNMLGKARAALAGGKDRPIVDRRYPNPGTMFDARAYPKGAWVLHMLRRQLGDEAFWKSVQKYGKDHQFKTVETSDFRKALEDVTGRDLERYFHDWTERPGHPVLDVASEYLPETKQVRVAVKQTQSGEPFAFPLAVAVRFKDGKKPVILREEVRERESVLYAAVSERPVGIEVDPDLSLLAELKETKGRDWWSWQLGQAEVVGRVRAAEHFGKSKIPADRELLAKALRAEKFWGVQAEIAAALGDSGGETARDALLDGLNADHPKARRACATQLGKFRRDAKVAEALKKLLDKGDASYFVEAATLASYAKLEQKDAINVLLPWLTKSSYQEVLRGAALEGLGETGDLAALDTLLAWTKRGKHRAARVAAIQAVAKLAQATHPTDEQRAKLVGDLAACLDGETPLVRRTAVTALRDLGRSAQASLAAVEALRLHDPDDRVRDLAAKAVEQIRSQAPAPVEVTRLREELDKLRKAQDDLRDRLLKYEKVERKVGAEP